MFLEVLFCALFCRWLLRQSRSWIAFELKAAAAAMVTSVPVTCAAGLILQNFIMCPGTLCLQLGVVFFHAPHVVQSVLQY